MAAVPRILLSAGSRASVPSRAMLQTTRPVATRSFQSSSTLMKKNRKPLEVEQDYADPDAEDNAMEEDDLFASPSTSTSSVQDPSAQLQPLLNRLGEIMTLDSQERKREFSDVKVGTLRRIVQLYPEEEVEGLKEVLRQWRVLGGRVTRKTAEEIVGRLCNLNRSDLALEIIQDRSQYGLPELPTHTQSRLHQALLESTSPTVPSLSAGIPISETLATLHLALRQQANQDPISQSELLSLVSQVKRVKVEAKQADEWREAAKGILERAGGSWAEAAKRIEGAAI